MWALPLWLTLILLTAGLVAGSALTGFGPLTRRMRTMPAMSLGLVYASCLTWLYALLLVGLLGWRWLLALVLIIAATQASFCLVALFRNVYEPGGRHDCSG